MLKCGIVGLPNVGKSTLFNAITKNQALAANYPFATIEPNVGIVLVPDQRLEQLKIIYKPQRVIPTSYEFIDIAGLVKGASKGEGLGNQFLSHIREVDAICQVVRCFDDENITHVDGTVDPIRDIETITLELQLSDLEQIEKTLARLGKKAKAKDPKTEELINILESIKLKLNNNETVSKNDYTDEQLKLIKSFNLLSLKPTIYLANLKEDDLLNPMSNKHFQVLSDYANKMDIDLIAICAQVEYEISQLAPEEKLDFLESYGLKESGLDQVIAKSYDLLGLKTYFTAGEKEVRAWTFKKGYTAPNCAGIIHSDFERGFIKAEVISYDDLIKHQTPQIVKEKGLLRLEGKDYLVKDGDIILFRFNV